MQPTPDWPQHLWQQLSSALADMEITLSKQQQQMLVTHCKQLALWNKKINLTAITEPSHMLSHHLLDSLSILAYLEGDNILDVGSGGGFPGIPLAIACPQKKFTLLDSSNKKCSFLRHIVHHLDLNNVKVIQHRVDSFSSERCFATIVARAWSSLVEMLKQCSHLLCDQGKLINMKGKYPTAELAAIKQPYQVHTLAVPGLSDCRHLIIMQRENND